ncbi:hypothetical protein ACFXTO_044264 [Malus domestica]
MEQKPACDVSVHSQTASSPFELKREFSLGEALEYLMDKSMIGQEGADTQGHQDEKMDEYWRSTGISPVQMYFPAMFAPATSASLSKMRI